MKRIQWIMLLAGWCCFANAQNEVLRDCIVNAAFDEENLDGWTTWKEGNGGNVQYQPSEQTTADGGTISKFAERWIGTYTTLGDWSISQVVSDLPKGRYRLSALIWADVQGNTEVVAEGFYIYASTDGMEVQGTAQIDPSLASCFTPASVEIDVFNGELEVGFRVENTNANWTGVDNFELEYLGETSENVYDILASQIEKNNALIDEYDGMEMLYSNATNEAYYALLAEADEMYGNQDADDETVLEMVSELAGMRAVLKADVAAYEKLSAFFYEGGIDKYYEKFPDGDEWPALDAYYDKNVTELEGLLIDYTKADSIIASANAAYLSDMKRFMESGQLDDMTLFATNVDFTEGATTGWTRTWIRGGGNDGAHYNNTDAESDAFGGAYEFWNVDNFDMYQEIKNLPDGFYKVCAKAFYRPADNASWQAAWGVEGDETNKILAYLYANDEQVELPHVSAGAETELAETSGAIQLTGLAETDPIYNHWIPNSMESFRRYANKYPEAYSVSVVCMVADETLRFGVKQPTKGLGNHWTIFTDFSIEYLGDEAESCSKMLQDDVEEALALVKDVLVTTAMSEAFSHKLNALTCSTVEEYKAAKSVIDEETEKIAANIAAWKAYKKLHGEAQKVVNSGIFDPENEHVQSFVNYLETEVTDHLQSLTLTTEEVEEATLLLDQEIKKLWTVAIVPNTDVTAAFFTNVDFEQGMQGWIQNNNYNSVWVNYGIAECPWQFDIYQETEMAAPGLYEMVLNGYYKSSWDMAESYKDYLRAKENGRSDLPHTNAYVNNGMAPLKNVFSEQVPVNELYSDDTYLPAEDATVWYPEGVYSASQALAAGKYQVSAYGVVEKKGDPLRIGVKEQFGNTARSYFDNIKVIYRGYQMDHLSASFERNVAAIKEMFVGSEVLSLVAEVEEAAALAKAANDSLALFDALAALQELSGKIDSSAYEFNTLYMEAIKMQESLDDFTGTQVDAARSVSATILEGIKNGTYETSDVADLRRELSGNSIDFSLFPTPSSTKVRGGTEFILPVSFTNDADNVSAFQCRIQLPEGLSIPMNEDDEYDIWLNKDRVAGSHTLVSSLQEDGSILVAVYSSKSAAFKGNEGEMFYVRLAVSNEAEEEQEVGFSDIRISTTAAVERVLYDQNVWYYVKHYTPMDINKDGVVSTDDREALINHLLGTEDANFSFDAADLDEDGFVSMKDLMALNDSLNGAVDCPEDFLSSDSWVSLYRTSNYAERGEIVEMPCNVYYDGNLSAFMLELEYSPYISIESVELPDNVSATHLLKSVYTNFGERQKTRYMIYSPTNAVISKNEDNIKINVRVRFSEELSIGEDVTIGCRGELVSPTGLLSLSNGAVYYFTIVRRGDVNMDGMITHEDRDALIDYSNGVNVAGYSYDAADLNKDNEVTLVDLVALNDTLNGVTERPADSLTDVGLNTQNQALKASNKTFTLPVFLDHTGSLTAIKGYIEAAPDFMVLESIELSDRVADDHEIRVQDEGNGRMRYVVYSLTNAPITGTEGVIMEIKGILSETAQIGQTGTVCVACEELTSPGGVSQRWCYAYADISVVLDGDANGDGGITIDDMTAALNALTGQPDWNFQQEAVDMNEDGEISIADVVAVIRILLNQGVPEAEIALLAESAGFTFLPEEKTIRSHKDDEMWTVSMENSVGITAFQCDLYLPEGISLRGDGGDNFGIRLTDRADATHQVIAVMQNDGSIRVVVYSAENALFSGTEGALFTMGVMASKGADTSSRVAFKNIRVCTPDVEEYKSDDVVATLNVKHYKPADVNGDDNISIVDVVAVVNGLLGTMDKNFVFDAADMNQDGNITIVDVVAVVNTLLNGGVVPSSSVVTRSAVHQDLHVTDITVSEGQTILTVALDNAPSYSGLQFDMYFPEGMSITDVSMNGKSSHMVSFKEHRVVVYSLGNEEFVDGESLMTISMENTLDDEVDLGFTNVYAATSNGLERALSDTYVTSIKPSQEELNVTVQGQSIVIESPKEQVAVIVSMNGAVQEVQLSEGTNRVAVAGKGVYLVRVAGKTVKVMI